MTSPPTLSLPTTKQKYTAADRWRHYSEDTVWYGTVNNDTAHACTHSLTPSQDNDNDNKANDKMANDNVMYSPTRPIGVFRACVLLVLVPVLLHLALTLVLLPHLRCLRPTLRRLRGSCCNSVCLHNRGVRSRMQASRRGR